MPLSSHQENKNFWSLTELRVSTNFRHLRSPELLLGEVDGPEWNPEPENGATTNKKSELKLPVFDLLDFVHLWCVHVVRGIRATHVHRAGGVEPPRGGSLPRRDETRRGKKGSASENSRARRRRKKLGRRAWCRSWGLVGGPRARPLTRRRAPSLVASCFNAFIANCDAIVASILLFCTTSKPWRARFDFQTFKFEIGFCRSGWFSICVPDLTKDTGVPLVRGGEQRDCRERRERVRTWW